MGARTNDGGRFWNAIAYKALLRAGNYEEIAAHAVRLESRTNLLFSFEKMAARRGEIPGRSKAVGGWPVRLRLWQREGRWPILTVFGFIGRPDTHIFLKPTVTRAAAREYGFDFEYASPPSWKTYRSVIEFAETVRRDLKDLRPRDMIDLQSFIWVQGSDEYQERAES